MVVLLTVVLTLSAAPPRYPLPGKRQMCRTYELAEREGRLNKAPQKASVRWEGTLHQLVILVDYPDKTFKNAEPLTLWQKIFNEQGYSEDKFRGSVHDYFYDQSNGLLDLEFDVCMVHLDSVYSYYGKNDSQGDDLRLREMVSEAVAKVDTTLVTDWSPYDWDGDGEVEQVFLLFAGMGENDGGDDDTVWPCQWSMKRRQKLYDGRYAFDFGCFAELSGYSNYASFGVLCHEYSHCLGLPDFYMTVDPWSSIVAYWSLMDYGCYAGDGGYRPVGYSAYERMSLGWMDVEELTKPSTISGMTHVANQGPAYKVTNSGNSDEFYIIENRQPVGWDAGLPGSGLLVWHVDYSASAWANNTLNNSALHRRVSIVPANNKALGSDTPKTTAQHIVWMNTQKGWTYPYEDNDSLTDNSVPAATMFSKNADEQKLMSKPITAMHVDGDGLASFKFMGGDDDAAGIKAIRRTPDDGPLTVFDLRGRRVGRSLDGLPRGVYIIRYANGETRKVIREE